MVDDGRKLIAILELIDPLTSWQRDWLEKWARAGYPNFSATKARKNLEIKRPADPAVRKNLPPGDKGGPADDQPPGLQV